MYEVRQLSLEEIEALRIQSPYADIKEWQLLGDNVSLGYFSTADEAALEVSQWQGRDAVQSAIDEKLPYLIDELERVASWYGLDSAEIRNMLRAAV